MTREAEIEEVVPLTSAEGGVEMDEVVQSPESDVNSKTGIEAEEYVPGALNGRALFFLFQWITISGGMIMFNKWLMTKRGFPHPMSLTSWHMIFGTVMTQILIRAKPDLFPSITGIGGSEKVNIDARTFWTRLFPVGFFFAVSLVFANKAYH